LISNEDKKFGQLLLDRGIVTPDQLAEAFRYKKRQDDEIAQILINRGFAASKAVYTCLADHLNIPFVELSHYDVDTNVLELLPKELASKHKVFPVFRIENSLTITMVNPGDVQVIDALHRETGFEIEPAVSPESDIVEAIRTYYDTGQNLDSSFDEVIQHIEREQPKLEEKTSAERLKKLSAETPVVKLVDLIIAQAIMDRASDIHIEPEEDCVQVRYRIDGILHENINPPKHLQAAVISRIKILAELDIAETRVPQDGRFPVTLSGRTVDLRISTLPTVYGENVVMRILDRDGLMPELSHLGLVESDFDRLKTALASSYGVIMVSGPTGSGKTTTLYSALDAINSPEKKIVTIEDPVEYRLKRIRQCQVNLKSGLTFAAGLRSILRQDPDVVMIGEIRDTETAKIAVEAALTGHLVLSTIHTNDAPGSITRLTEMGIEPFLTSSATVAVIAQRLLRRLCIHCRESYEPSRTVLDGLNMEKSVPLFYRSKGCPSCRSTGYWGRIGIYEVMLVDEPMRKMILENASATDLKRAAMQAGMHTLRQNALQRAQDGTTSLEEVFRVTNKD